MKIVIVTETINTHSGARAPMEIAQGLAKLGNSVTIAGVERNLDLNLKKELERQGIKIILFSGVKIFQALKLFLTLKKLKPEIISFQGTLPFFIASKLTGAPLVKTYYGTQLDAYFEKIFPRKPTYFDKILNFLGNIVIWGSEKIQFILSSEIIAISKFTANQAQNLYKSRIPFCYLGASDLGKPQSNIKRTNFILSVSRFTPYKGFHQLIAACGNLPLIIVGSRQNSKYLNYLEKIKTPNCQILVDIPDWQLANYYKNCLFYASFDKLPFFGLPIAEAAYFAKPSISGNFGAAKELIEDGKTGFIVEGFPEFQKRAKEFFDNPKISRKMGIAAKKRVGKMFNWRNTALYYNKIFNQILTKKTQKNSTFPSFLLIFFLGTILRIMFLNQHNFWFDEAFSYFVARENLFNLVQAIAADNHPPLYFLVLHFWIKIFGNSEFALRSLSAGFGVLAIPAIFWLGKLLFNQRVGLISSLILALSPAMVYFSTETRMYSLFVFLTILTIISFISWLKNPKFIFSFWFIITFILLLYTHYYAYLLFLPLNLLFLTLKNYRKIWSRFLILQLPIIGFLLPWLIVYLTNHHPQIFAQSLIIGIPATFTSFILGGTGVVTLREFFSPNLSASIVAIFILTTVFFGIIFLKSILNLSLRIKISNQFLLFLLFLPLLFLILASFARPIYVVRPTIFLAPFFYLIIASNLANLRDKSFKLTLTIGAILLLTTTLIQRLNLQFSGSNLKEASFLTQNSVNLHTSILTYYPFRYYQPESINFLITKNPLTLTTQKIIGGQNFGLGNLNYDFAFIEFESGANLEEVRLVKEKISNNFEAKKIKNFVKINITFFEK